MLLSYVMGYIPASAEDTGEETKGWVTKADLPETRSAAATAAVDGKIYVIGGTGGNDRYSKNQTYMYDPKNDTWSQKADMPTARTGAAVAVVDGKIYVIGGYDTSNIRNLNTVEIYDPKTDSWETAPEYPETVQFASASVIENKIYVMSGSKFNPDKPQKERKTNYCYDTETKTWTAKKELPINANGLATAVVNGKIYAIGGNGETYSSGIWDTIYEYDPEKDTWNKKHNLINKITNATATVINDKIYIMGGTITSSLISAKTQVYNPDDDSISEIEEFKNARTAAGSAAIGNDLYIIGGTTDTRSLYGLHSYALKTVQMYTTGNSSSDKETPESPSDPKPDQSSSDRALLVITMTNGLEKEFDLSMDEVNDFISWYDQKDAGSGSSKYAIDKHDNNKGPFSSRKDYVIFSNILSFEVNEYSSK
ncbi:hypothetical protein FZC77_08090 [Bacillus swezeyi]|uniref:DUF1668 domain-containing protein n=1 Tax=Bacillus swezeyi TaxID=1925020 RepID=A0A5M8RU07_9BACI|nr:hypothetical protein DX927_08265 [Bacillus swezeyi]TYS37362.1 hypothetical protein FZC77_08090 [Bacillus swezeyi]